MKTFDFKTFVDIQSVAFEEYISSLIAKLCKSNSEYRAIEDKIDGIYKQYPHVMAALDAEKSNNLTEQECEALIKVLELRNKLYALESEVIYFRGCYDSVGYLKKAGIL